MQFEEERPRRYRRRQPAATAATGGARRQVVRNYGCVVNGVDGYMCVHDHRVVVVCAPPIVSLIC